MIILNAFYICGASTYDNISELLYQTSPFFLISYEQSKIRRSSTTSKYIEAMNEIKNYIGVSIRLLPMRNQSKALDKPEMSFDQTPSNMVCRSNILGPGQTINFWRPNTIKHC